jgi:hypothetical protein
MNDKPLVKAKTCQSKDLPRNWGTATAIDGFKLIGNITPKLRGRPHDDIWELLHLNFIYPENMKSLKCVISIAIHVERHILRG